MNKKIIILIILSFFSINFNAQDKKFDTQKFNYEFIGVLLISKSQLYSYKLEFNIDNDSIRGYSYTDLAGPNETKSYIYGTYNKKSQKITFEEKDVLYTKSDINTDEFCFIKSTGKLKLKKRKNSFSSKFEGFYENGESCAEGKIKVVGTKFIKKRLNKLYKKVKKRKKIDSITKEKVNPEKILMKFGKTTLAEDEKITIYLKSSDMKMEIWDYGKEDGDIIDLYLNGKRIIQKFKLKKKKKKLVLKMQKGKNTIKISTVDAGKIKTNTAIIKIYDSSRFYELKSNINEGKSAEINIIVKE